MKVSFALGRLLSWTHNPDPPEEVYAILEAISDAELLFALTFFSGPVARLAWAAYGARRGFIEFEVRLTQAEGQLCLSFEGEGPVVHTTPSLDIDTRFKVS